MPTGLTAEIAKEAPRPTSYDIKEHQLVPVPSPRSVFATAERDPVQTWNFEDFERMLLRVCSELERPTVTSVLARLRQTLSQVEQETQ